MPDIPSTTQNSFVKVTPTNEALIKGIVNYGGVPAVSSAIAQILGENVNNYSFDNINLRISYKIPNTIISYTNFTGASVLMGEKFATAEEACTYAQKKLGYPSSKIDPVNENGQTICYLGDSGDSLPLIGYPEVKENPEEYLLYSTIAAQIQTNAATGDADANAFIADVCNPLNWSESEYPLDIQAIKAQLETNAPKD